MTIGRDLLTKAETVTVAAIETGVPTLVEAREIIAEFHLMIRRKTEAGLITWIERARASLVASFASGVAKDEAAVRVAITLPWSRLTGRLKVRSRASSSSDVKCTVEGKSICFKPD
jgi:transposase